MSQREEVKESIPETNSTISKAPPLLENSFDRKGRNGPDKPESNLKVKAGMARELSSMGLEIEAISRILRTDASCIEEWISLLNFEEESR